MKKTLLLLFVCLSLSLTPLAVHAAATLSYEWRTSVEIPFADSPKLNGVRNGVVITGTNPDGRSLTLQLVQKGYWTDTVVAESTIPSGRTDAPFRSKLYAPAGNGYYVRIQACCMRSGQITISSF